jgi:acylphosphatase
MGSKPRNGENLNRSGHSGHWYAGRVDRLTAVVSGRVQGVGFRYWVRRRAEALGLSGTATNLRDGDVEVIAEGDRGALEQLLDMLRGDDTPGFVGRISSTWSAGTGEFGGFRER